MKKIAASLISIIFGPAILGPIIFYVIFSHFTHILKQSPATILLIFLFNLLLPFLYIFIAYLTKRIKDLDMTDRKERIIPFAISITSFIATTVILKMNGSKELADLFVLFTLFLIINGTITLFWKISLHMAINVIWVNIMIFYYGSLMNILFITVLLIYWSRLKLKKHTKMQLVISFILNGLISYLYLFVYLSRK